MVAETPFGLKANVRVSFGGLHVSREFESCY
jgi:hypothetical protein